MYANLGHNSVGFEFKFKEKGKWKDAKKNESWGRELMTEIQPEQKN